MTWRPVFSRLLVVGTHHRKIPLKLSELLVSRPCSSFSSPSTATVKAVQPPRAVIEEATDTLDLIDHLLGVLGANGAKVPGYIFFDVDETLVTRDTCLVDGFRTTKMLMARLAERLGRTSEVFQAICREVEKDYYNADPRLVDPLLARVIRALKIQGHKVFALTSNTMDDPHTQKILKTLASYKIRFTRPRVKGELPRSGAVVMDHPVVHGIIFTSNQQTLDHDKGEVIAEFVGLTLRNCEGEVENPGVGGDSAILEEDGQLGCAVKDGINGSSRSQRRACLLVDNTEHKCQMAAESFLRGRGRAAATASGLDLYAVHFTEAENLVDSPHARLQLEKILERLRAQNCIASDVLPDDFFDPVVEVPVCSRLGQGGGEGASLVNGGSPVITPKVKSRALVDENNFENLGDHSHNNNAPHS